MNKTTTMFATMAATGAGYLAGILFAPKSGTDMRQQVKGKAKFATDAISGHISQAKRKMHTAASTAREKTNEMTDMVREPGHGSSTAHAHMAM